MYSCWDSFLGHYEKIVEDGSMINVRGVAKVICHLLKSVVPKDWKGERYAMTVVQLHARLRGSCVVQDGVVRWVHEHVRHELESVVEVGKLCAPEREQAPGSSVSLSPPSWCLQIEGSRLEQLYTGDVCWVLLAQPSRRRGRIALMASSSCYISGEAVVSSCFLFALKPGKRAWKILSGTFEESEAKHGWSSRAIERHFRKKIYALVLREVRAYGRGIEYSGCTGLWSEIRGHLHLPCM